MQSVQARAVKIDDAEMDALLRRFERPLLQYATRILGDSDRARDVVQETFVKLQKETRTELDHAPAKWLFTVCRNGALNICRKEKRMTYLDQELLETRESEQPAPYEKLEAKEAHGFLLKILGSLPPRQQEVLQLKFQNDLSYQEISEITELSVSNVGVLIHNALKTLRQRYGRASRDFLPFTPSNHLMKINLDDPNLTAFALGELSGAEREAMEQAVASSAEAQEFVTETQQLSRLLRSEYEGERTLPLERSSNIIRMEEQRRLWSSTQWGSLAAALAIFAVIGAFAVSMIQRNSGKLAGIKVRPSGNEEFSIVEALPEATTDTQPVTTPAQQNLLAMNPAAPPPPTDTLGFTEEKRSGGESLNSRGRFAAGKPKEPASVPARQPLMKEDLAESELPSRYRQDFDTATYDHVSENPFLPAATNPLSTFAIDVDTASYSNVRRFIDSGSLPPKDAVRVEEMVNYFTYDYREPEGDKPFSIDLDATACPWDSSHRLLRIGLKGRDVANENRPSSNLVFLLDVSGSMTPAERLPLVKQAMRLLVEKLTEKDRVAIVIYAGGSGLALSSTTGDRKETILRALEDLKAGGSTNGAEGIELAYKVAADNFIKGGVNRVILATDGDFNIGVTNQGDLIRLIEEKAKSGVFLSVLGVGTDNLKDSTMQKLADKGNGNYAYLDSLDEARKVLVQQVNGTLMTIAKDVKIQVEFNPARVASYRLIGYEKRMLRKEDFNNDKVDAGEIGAGHTVTALYEIVPAGTGAVDPSASVPPVDPLKYQAPSSAVATAQTHSKVSQEMVTVKLRYKKPDGDTSELTERSFVDNGEKFENAAPDLKFAAAVAEFGMILRDSQYKGKGTIGAVIEWAQEGKGRDAAGYRAGFIELARKTQALKQHEG